MAIALSNARHHPHKAGGGIASPGSGIDAQPANGAAITMDVPHSGGLIDSSIPGRTDRLPLAVSAESDIVPADVVSGLGQGGTDGGARLLMEVLRIGPADAVPHVGLAEGGGPRQVSILAAGSEFVIPHEDWLATDEVDGKNYLHRGVRSIGEGDTKRGHELLARMYRRVRQHTIEFLKHAPPPKK